MKEIYKKNEKKIGRSDETPNTSHKHCVWKARMHINLHRKWHVDMHSAHPRKRIYLCDVLHSSWLMKTCQALNLLSKLIGMQELL